MKLLLTAVLFCMAIAGCASTATSSTAPSSSAPPPAATVSATSAKPTHAVSPTPTRTHHTVAPTRSVAPPTPTRAQVSCHPLTSGGNCYEPGEFCRKTDHGGSGIAGDGKTITCKQNGSYWRWEPA